LHEDAGGAVAYGDTLDLLARGGVEDDEVGAAEEGDEDVLAVGGELEAVGAAYVGVEGLDYFFGGVVDDGDGAVLGVGHPDFFAVGRDVEAFGAVADGDEGFVPVGAVHRRRRGHVVVLIVWIVAGVRAGGWALLRHGFHVDDADGGGRGVAGDDVLDVGRDVDHVDAVLASAEDPVDFVGGGVVAADGLGDFGGEVEFATGEGEAVGSAEGETSMEGRAVWWTRSRTARVWKAPKP
jgi:hypothetical protein